MSFWYLFKSEMPRVIDKLKAMRQDIDEAKSSLTKLMEMESRIGGIDVATITDSFNVSLWAKDLNGRFLFVNKACCDTILKCSLPEALNLKNGDFKNDALSRVCMGSDQKVLDTERTRRFIEYATYEDGDGDVYLDVVKSPLYQDGGLIGTVGNAVIITDSIPERIKGQTRKSNSIEIPVDTTMSSKMFIGFLERRKEDRPNCGETSVRSGS